MRFMILFLLQSRCALFKQVYCFLVMFYLFTFHQCLFLTLLLRRLCHRSTSWSDSLCCLSVLVSDFPISIARWKSYDWQFDRHSYSIGWSESASSSCSWFEGFEHSFVFSGRSSDFAASCGKLAVWFAQFDFSWCRGSAWSFEWSGAWEWFVSHFVQWSSESLVSFDWSRDAYRRRGLASRMHWFASLFACVVSFLFGFDLIEEVRLLASTCHRLWSSASLLVLVCIFVVLFAPFCLQLPLTLFHIL